MPIPKTNRGLTDKNPALPGGGEKQALQISGTSVLRRRQPPNEFMDSKMTNMVWDFSRQQKVLPDRLPKAIVESTQGRSPPERVYRTMNKSGRPYALGVNVGGSPDDTGHPFDKPIPAKILK